MTDKTRGYIIPDPIDPGSEICIRVYVPNDNLYIAAFMRAYAYFGSWVAWEKDPTGKAAQAAAVWRTSIDRTAAEFDCSQGECGIMDIRQSTTTPCLIEKQAGCDGEWEQAADMRLCVPRMRTLGGVIQQWNGTEWVNAADTGSGDEPYDERTDGTVFPAWEEPPAGQDGRCLSAANALVVLTEKVSDIAQGNASEYEFVIWFSALAAAVAIFVGVGVIFVLAAGAIVALIATFGFDPSDWTLTVLSDPDNELLCALRDAYNDDGTMTEESWEALRSDINDIASGLSDEHDFAAMMLAEFVVWMLGPVGMSRIANGAGLVSAECVCGCESSLYYDFSSSQQGWALKYPTVQGIWTGSGWGCDYPQKQYDGVSILSPELPAMHICRVEVIMDQEISGPNPGGQFGNFDESVFFRVEDFGPTIIVPGELDVALNDRIVVSADEWFGGNSHMTELMIGVRIWYTPA